MIVGNIKNWTVNKVFLKNFMKKWGTIISMFSILIYFLNFSLFVYIDIMKFLEIHSQKKKISRVSKKPYLNYQV